MTSLGHFEDEPQTKGICCELHKSTMEDIERVHRRISTWTTVSLSLLGVVAMVVLAAAGFSYGASVTSSKNDSRVTAVERQYREIKMDLRDIRKSLETTNWILSGKQGPRPHPVFDEIESGRQ